jgi:hypothetical protein
MAQEISTGARMCGAGAAEPRLAIRPVDTIIRSGSDGR